MSGNLFGTLLVNGEAESYARMCKVIRVGTILERQSDGVQIKVSAVHASNLTFTAATYGSATSTSYDSGGVSWDIIAEAWSDYTDASATRAMERSWRRVGTQIHAESFEIPFTRKNTRMELVADETEHQIQGLLEKMQRQIAYSVIRSKPYYSGGYKFGDEAEEATMLGISTWPAVTQAETANTNVYVNAATAEISKTYLDNLIRNMWLDEHSDFNQGNWYILKAGLEWKANYLFGGGNYGVTLDIVQSGPEGVIAKATFRTREGMEFTNFGEASKLNTTPNMQKYMLHLALTRAECRVLRMATACGYTSMEEMDLSTEPKELPVGENDSKPATAAQVETIKALNPKWVEEEITQAQAKGLIQELSKGGEKS
jgi:hypothetical protein